MTTITLSGEIGAGKDTFADILAEVMGEAGLTVEVVKFAQPLKDTIALLGIPDSRELKEVVAEYRLEQQTLYDAIGSVFQYMGLHDRERLAYKMWSKMVACKFMFSSRQFQQWLGMGARELRADYFIHHLKMHTQSGQGVVFLVSDSRFANERAVADTGIFIERPDNPLRVVTNDASEAGIDDARRDAEYLAHNDGDSETWRDRLEGQARWIVESLFFRGYCDDENTGGAGE